MRFNDLPERYRKQAAAQIAVQNRVAVPAANLESDTGNVVKGANAHEKAFTPVSIRVHSVRKRLTDPDAVSAKWILDSLVEAGLLPDDSPKYVKEVRLTQEQGSPEETIIEIYEGGRNEEGDR